MDDPDVRQQPLGQRLRYGAMLGLFAGTLFAIMASTLVGLGAGRSLKDVPITSVFGLYLGGGLLTGLVFGLLAPLAVRRLGAVVVGICAMFPTGVLVILVVRQPPFSLNKLIVTALIVALAIGGGGGYQLWEPVKPRRRGHNPFANLG